MRLILTITAFFIGTAHTNKERCTKTIQELFNSAEKWQESIKKTSAEQKTLIDKLFKSSDMTRKDNYEKKLKTDYKVAKANKEAPQMS